MSSKNDKILSERKAMRKFIRAEYNLIREIANALAVISIPRFNVSIANTAMDADAALAVYLDHHEKTDSIFKEKNIEHA